MGTKHALFTEWHTDLYRKQFNVQEDRFDSTKGLSRGHDVVGPPACQDSLPASYGSSALPFAAIRLPSGQKTLKEDRQQQLRSFSVSTALPHAEP